MFAVLALLACEREDRAYRSPPPRLERHIVSATPVAARQHEKNAYLVSQGQTLFHAFNCSGCHSNFGGGGMGPPLMDDQWIYGDTSGEIVASIIEGRPNGMPSFRGRIADEQALELAAYIRSLSGQLRKDVSPGRDDHISGPTPSSSEALVAKGGAVPPHLAVAGP